MSLFIVMVCCAFHFSDGISWIPRYTYGSFWCRTGMDRLYYEIGCML
jgi:hypothetical protein